MDTLSIIVLAVAVFITYFFGIISGGTGLIVRSALILLGVPSQIAVGSARISHLGTRPIGILQFHRHKKIDWPLAIFLFIPSAVGGLFGAQLVSFLDESLLSKIIGALVVIMAFVLFFRKDIGTTEPVGDISLIKKVFGFFSVIISGIFGAVTGGSGVMFSYALIFFYNKTYITSSATRKVAGFGGSLSSIAFFLYKGFVDWQVVLILFIAGGLGSYLGVNYGIKKGEEWVRMITLAVMFILGVKILLF